MTSPGLAPRKRGVLRTTVRAVEPADRPWMLRFLLEHWGSQVVAAHGEILHPADLPGFIASADGVSVGLLNYEIRGSACEVVQIHSGLRSQGVGTALLQAVEDYARQSGCTRLWLVTTNDNLDALRFYQRRGFVLSDLHPGSIEQARSLKPEIPLVGAFGIPIRDEIELEMRIRRASDPVT